MRLLLDRGANVNARAQSRFSRADGRRAVSGRDAAINLLLDRGAAGGAAGRRRAGLQRQPVLPGLLRRQRHSA